MISEAFLRTVHESCVIFQKLADCVHVSFEYMLIRLNVEIGKVVVDKDHDSVVVGRFSEHANDWNFVSSFVIVHVFVVLRHSI